MALIRCPECGTEVSDRADSCVNCGCPINKQTAAEVPSPAFTTPVSGAVRLEKPSVTPLSWKKPKASIIAAAVFLLIAAIMNPSERTHQSVAAAYFAKKIQDDSGMDNLVGLMGSAWTDAFFVNFTALTIERQNLIFFSLTRNKPRDEIIGFGAFGNVWLFADEPETAEDEYKKKAAKAEERVKKKLDKKVAAEEQKRIKYLSRYFTDERDRLKYRTVKIDGKTWMAENLNYKTEKGSLCYGNNEDNCKKYGRLYDWETAKVVCPKGWHLPSRIEWQGLVTVVGGDNVAGKALKSSNGMGNNDYGFSALLNDGFNGFWWTATEGNSGYAYCRVMSYTNDYVDESYRDKNYRFSVRCLQD